MVIVLDNFQVLSLEGKDTEYSDVIKLISSAAHSDADHEEEWSKTKLIDSLS